MVENTNQSPRFNTPGVDRAYPALKASCSADIVVIGGGIAGCMSAYFALHNTSRDVMLLEGDRIARGASGHNAGQIDVFFEKPIGEIIETYGIQMTTAGYRAMFTARGQLEEIIETIERAGQYNKYIGYNAYATLEQLLDVCEQLSLFEKMGLEINELFVNSDCVQPEMIPSRYHRFVNRISTAEGNNLIGSETLERVCMEATHYATINTAALCHAIIIYLLATYPDRFHLYEHTSVSSIITKADQTVLTIPAHDDTPSITILGNDVIVCTNAYHAYTLNAASDALHTQEVRGYMAGYYIPTAKTPSTVGYQPPGNGYSEGYYYQSARHMTDSDHIEHTLITIGGPDMPCEGDNCTYPDNQKQNLDAYISHFYKKPIGGEYYRWGDMGYTESGFRLIGAHPQHAHIWYNIGCNGVGILGSIHGGWKIGQMLQGEKMERSIFDIQPSKSKT